MPPLVVIERIAKRYRTGDTIVGALSRVSLKVDRGEFVAVMGPSGSGKSTLMNLLGCLDTPTAGQYILDGLPVDQLERNLLAAVRNRKIGFVFQQFNLLPRQTALENVALPLVYLGGVPTAERRARAALVLEQVGLGDRAHHRPTGRPHRDAGPHGGPPGLADHAIDLHVEVEDPVALRVWHRLGPRQ